MNPDGGEYDIATGSDTSWRKNRQPNAGSIAVGTDLNRNWGCCGGSSGTPSSETYRGACPWNRPTRWSRQCRWVGRGASPPATVLTPQNQIAALIAQINALVAAGELTSSNAKPLINTLENASKHLDGGQVSQTCKELGDFIKKVEGDIQTGKLTAANGQALINAANAIRANIGC